MNIEFVSYDGKYPNLCSGNLVFKVNNNRYYGNGLISGGCVNCDEYGDYFTEDGPWEICWDYIKDENGNYIDNNHFDEITKKMIISMINENIPYGCCGGCI